MLKKIGLVAVGATAGLLVAAPLASAAELPELPIGTPNGATCSFTSGGASAVSEISGESLNNQVAQSPTIFGEDGQDLGNEANCRDIGNGQFNGMDLSFPPSAPDSGVEGGLS